MSETKKAKKQAGGQKDAMKPFSMKMSADDEKKLDQIRQFLNMDSFASVIRKIIRDYKIG